MDMKSLFLLLALTSLATCATNYAVIVVGSKGYSNYRHQADGCRAYHTLISKGFQSENIIHLSYDDIANNPNNPFPGKIFAEPSPNGEGKDVYENCKIDYRGDSVNPANFLAVISGQQEKVQGPVLKSTSEDHVFIFFDDHGARNLVAFPNGTLHKEELHETFRLMQSKQMYSKLVIYVEACFSGSMFLDNLEEELNIYAVTAANERESSYATYCYPYDMVNGKHLNTCLSNLFSMNWMDNLHKTDNFETLQEQFDYLLTKTDKSHVNNFGDLSFLQENMLDFESGNYGTNKFLGYREEEEISEYMKAAKASVIPALSVDHTVKRLVAENNKDDEEKENDAIEIEQVVLQVQKFFSAFRKAFGLKRDDFGKNVMTGDELSCYKNNVELYLNKFGADVDFAFGFLGYINAACSKTTSRQVADFITFN